MRRFFLVVGIVLIFSAICLFVYDFFVLKNQKGALQITSSPESKVYLNNEYIGNTPLCRCGNEDGSKHIGEMLKVGEYDIKLVPVSGGFNEYQEKINIESSVLTVVDRKFAKGASSESFIIYLTKLQNIHKNYLTIVSSPPGVNVSLDGSDIGKTPIQKENITESDHSLLFSKEGYKTKIVKIRATNGYKLTTQVSLGIDMNFFEDQKKASDSALLTPTPQVVSTTKVIILETGTGFLRVRETDSLSSKEIARITPGDELELIDEKDEWTNIRLKDGRSGWVSSQYVQRKDELTSENIDDNNN